MVLIISSRDDISTNIVQDWLNFLNKEYFRIDEEEELYIEFSLTDIIFRINSNNVSINDINSVWYRRGNLTFKNFEFTDHTSFDILIKDEVVKLNEYIHYKLMKKKCLNSFQNFDVNKLIVNDIARSLGIATPNDYLVSNSKQLHRFLKQSKSLFITKTISGNCIQKFQKYSLFNYTTVLDNKSTYPDFFFPSLVQNYVPKKYELRIFFLENEFYSMAIFTEKNSKSKIDYRNNDFNLPNIEVPYDLPSYIQDKLKVLMKKIQLNSGSIDMIVTPENEYVFLEVNPVGQFGMVSYPCNYNIEKKIAEFLYE
ncbi:grasp-with-spasm system ATP-grasp peptide maturase [Flavobacterium sp.]|jgi:ATP-GRASP peptide maturase of grasp-with-spasm system|uniref:grasp-with-spasm system ATP-grasp peptide maturase n=1 Tax=Flavobacterium sp. TaxID=239 RepID=UPI0037C1344C